MMSKGSTYLLAGLMALGLAGCGGGSSSSDDSVDPPIGDISGEWYIDETITSTTCDYAYGNAYYVSVAQNENSITVTAPIDEPPYEQDFTGTLDGSTLRWSGSYPEEGGTNTITSMSLTIASDCNSLSGNVNWRWSDGSYTCTGTTYVVGDRYYDLGCS